MWAKYFQIHFDILHQSETVDTTDSGLIVNVSNSQSNYIIFQTVKYALPVDILHGTTNGKF